MITFIALLLVTAVSPAEPIPLAPSGKWRVEYADTMCVLTRDYGIGKDSVTLGFRPWPMGTETEVLLLTRNHAVTVPEGRAQVTLAPTGRATSGSYARYPMPKGAGGIATLTLGEDALAGLEGSTAIRIRLGTEIHTFAIPRVDAAMTALRTCQNDLLKSWGLDPNERSAVVTPPRGNPGAMFSSNAYPPAAIRAHEEGRTVAIASIDPTGKVTTCAIAATSGSLALDQATCEVLKGGGRHFSPGLDKDGKPVASHLVVPVHWRLP